MRWVILALAGGFLTTIYGVNLGLAPSIAAGAGTVVFGTTCAVGMMLTDTGGGR
jgi:heme A synthase